MTPHVLVAEDDAEMRAAIVRSLADDGMSVEEARSGGEALAKLGHGGVDLFVTDVMMPDLGGVQAAAMARSAGAHLPILVMTARRDEWIVESVRKLQFADLLYKPFSAEELLERAHTLLARRDSSSLLPPAPDSERHVFPPALVPLLRSLVGDAPVLAIPDEALTELLSVVFFAGLETEEGQRNPTRVLFVGPRAPEQPPIDGVPPTLFRWSTLRFVTEHALSVTELVKLAVASTNGREHVEVAYREGRLVVTGLAREGVNLEGDPSLKIVVERPGGMSIRVGRSHVLDYEHGRVQSLAARVFLAGGPVRRALESAALASGLSPVATARYLDLVRALVARLSAHGRGGILVFACGDRADFPEAGYRTHADISLAAMLRRLDALHSTETNQLLGGALESEIQHTTLEIGALTALDGATMLDARLALLGFGCVLPVGGEDVSVVEAEDVEGARAHPFDLRVRGMRHRAASAWAFAHPGHAVFVASQDGDIGCMMRAPGASAVTLWRFRASDLHA